MIGKTNLDQFATGLVGVRCPYGTPRTPPTARSRQRRLQLRLGGGGGGRAGRLRARHRHSRSGRVPAAFNHLVGLKPTLGSSPSTLPTPARSLSLTNPQIGNYGTNSADNEAAKPYIEGLVDPRIFPSAPNWRSQQVADGSFERFQVPVHL